jgi:hypothetical protein
MRSVPAAAAAGPVWVLAQSPTKTPRWGPIAQPGGFVLVVLGNATNQVSSTVQWQVPVTLMQFPDCGLGCNASTLVADRVLNVPSTVSGDANLYSPYSDRPFSMSGDGTKTGAPSGSWVLGFSTYQQGRLVISDDQQVRWGLGIGGSRIRAINQTFRLTAVGCRGRCTRGHPSPTSTIIAALRSGIRRC